MTETRRCSSCRKDKPLTEFRKAPNKNNPDYVRTSCKECEKQSRKEKSDDIRNAAYAYMHEKGCRNCQEKNVTKLQFNHLPGTEKLFNVSEELKKRTIDPVSLWKEIAKCEILCANCHSEVTAEQQSWYSVDFMDFLLSAKEEYEISYSISLEV